MSLRNPLLLSFTLTDLLMLTATFSSLVMETSGKPKWRRPNELTVHFIRIESRHPFL